MKEIIIIVLISFATVLHSQSESIDTIQVDTITPNPTSRQLIKELTERLAQIEQAKVQVTKDLMLIITAYMEDPRKLVGLTNDYKILKKQ